MSIADSVLGHVASIPAYQPGTPISTVAREYHVDAASLVKLASNENPLGMSPAARTAVIDAMSQGGRYPDPACFELSRAIAAHVGVSPSQVIVGAGSVDLIVLAVRALLDADRSAIVPQYAFAAYGNAVRSVGARKIVVPARNYAHDVDAIAASVDRSARIVFIASVNNPTGLSLAPSELEHVFESVASDVLIILDEAYREYMPANIQGDIVRYLGRYPNVLWLRTFSKIYGLASLRVGYAIGDPRLVETLKRLQTPFVVNAQAQAGAIAALADDDFVESTRNLAFAERARLAAKLDEAGVQYLPSAGNFMLIRVADGERAYRSLLTQNVIVRPVANYGLPDWIRVTVGLPHENDLFFSGLIAARAAGDA
jgi:histidinol-phosphate aminotransferase